MSQEIPERVFVTNALTIEGINYMGTQNFHYVDGLNVGKKVELVLSNGSRAKVEIKKLDWMFVKVSLLDRKDQWYGGEYINKHHIVAFTPIR